MPFLPVLFYITGCNDASKSADNQEISELPEKDYAANGMKYATSTQKILGKNLIGALQEGGAIEALRFCNIQAIPLTDSMTTMYDASIKRVTDKPNY